MKYQHTPGPWAALPSTERGAAPGPVHLCAKVPNGPWKVLAQNAANARLQAGAPVLLQALENLVDDLVRVCPDMATLPQVRHAREAIYLSVTPTVENTRGDSCDRTIYAAGRRLMDERGMP
jgi:hypothetical protein